MSRRQLELKLIPVSKKQSKTVRRSISERPMNGPPSGGLFNDNKIKGLGRRVVFVKGRVSVTFECSIGSGKVAYASSGCPIEGGFLI